jgi:DNA-binding NarL/FixJ family response regulator
VKIKILIVDDHQIVREGLRALLAFDAELEIVGEAENGRVAIELAQHLKPDVVLMDVVVPSLNGVEALRRLRTLAPKTKVIILSSYRELEYVHPALDSGAAGYLLKHSAAGELLRAIREARAGKTVLSPAIEQSLRQEPRPASPSKGARPKARSTSAPGSGKSSGSLPRDWRTSKWPPSWASASRPSRSTGST